ncbi:hypothetical protein V8F20_007485 [Naviculisporaceae sp. PSN 640]
MTTRSNHFRGSHHAALHTSGPVRFLNPTTRYHLIQAKSQAKLPTPGAGASSLRGEAAGQRPSTPRPLPRTHHEKGRPSENKVYHIWRSRDNRKGRHAAVIVAGPNEKGQNGDGKSITLPSATNTMAETWKGIVKMFVRWPVWDVSFDVAVVFTIGSIIWVINGSFVFMPIVAPWTEFPNEADLWGGVTACIGATIFEFGSVLFMLEAVNENRTDCFGWALEEALEDPHGQRLRSDDDNCRHHHHEKRGLLHAAIASATSLTSSKEEPLEDKTAMDQMDNNAHAKPGSDRSEKSTTQRRWEWFPTRHELTSHYLRDIGFLACLSQMIGATVFWIAGFTGLPPIYDALEGYGPAAVNCVYWLPQVIGGTGFIISAALFMLEVQDKWYKPAWGILGWHVGAWNLVGAIGFTLCGALGFGKSWALEYGSVMATYVGSWAFLIGSIIQWYESLDKYPVSVGVVPPSLRDEEHHDSP